MGKQHNSSRIGSTQLDPSLVTVVSFISISDLCFKMCAQTCPVIIMKITFVSSVLSDAFVQRQRRFPLPSPPSRVGTSAASNKLQSSPRDGDRASASGVSLRRGDAEVQVGELPPHPHPQSHVSLSLSPLLLLFFFKLIFILLLKPRSIFTKT